jgi:hypothetical protein
MHTAVTSGENLTGCLIICFISFRSINFPVSSRFLSSPASYSMICQGRRLTYFGNHIRSSSRDRRSDSRSHFPEYVTPTLCWYHSVIFHAVPVVSKEGRRLVLPRTSCYSFKFIYENTVTYPGFTS